MKKNPSLIHPFLFALFPVLSLYSHNAGEVFFYETVAPVGVVLGCTVLLLLLCKLMLKDDKKAAAMVSLFLLLFFSYMPVYREVKWQIGSFEFDRHRFLIPVWGIIFTGGVYFIRKARSNLSNLTKVLNITALCLVLIPSINVGVYGVKHAFYPGDINEVKEIKGVSRPDIDKCPDIYYIILDRYAREDMLKMYFDFDNSEFIDYLSDKGFYVAEQSMANYLKTAQSLAASLNMEYLNHLTEVEGENSDNWKPIYKMLQDYKVQRFLRSIGYKYIHLGSWWEPTSRNKYADINYNLYWLPHFSFMVYQNTLLYPVLLELGVYDERKVQWKRVLYKFKKLNEISEMEGPTFAFAHMLITHSPYVFKGNGDFLTEREFDEMDVTQAYTSQVVFTNKELKKLIDKLLSDPEKQPIIILQADEGKPPLRVGPDYKTFNWNYATKDELQEKLSIFNTYYLPGIDGKVLYPSITPVNSFRLIFRSYFNADLDLLPDMIYAHKDEYHLYDFIDVTDKIKY